MELDRSVQFRDDEKPRRDDREIRRVPPVSSRDGESNWRSARGPHMERPVERTGDRDQIHRQRPDREEFAVRSTRPGLDREERDRPSLRLPEREKPKGEFIFTNIYP